jgi:type IX secretion system PorP/SprF family membrane protein
MGHSCFLQALISIYYYMRLLLIFTMLFLNLGIYAQPDDYYSMYWNKKSLFNPASSGVKHKYYAALTGRQQWVGIKDAPCSFTAAFDTKLNSLHSGTGINFTYGEAGAVEYYNANINYNYQISFGNNTALSIGASGGLILDKLDLSQIESMDGEDFDDKYTTLSFKFGLNYVSKHLDIGLSSLSYKTIDHSTDNSTDNFYALQTSWLFCSYWFPLCRNITVEPNLLLRMTQSEFNDMFIYPGILFTVKERFWTGFSCSNHGVFGATVGYDIVKKFRIGYSFDYKDFGTTVNNYGNHEMVLAIIL